MRVQEEAVDDEDREWPGLDGVVDMIYYPRLAKIRTKRKAKLAPPLALPGPMVPVHRELESEDDDGLFERMGSDGSGRAAGMVLPERLRGYGSG